MWLVHYNFPGGKISAKKTSVSVQEERSEAAAAKKGKQRQSKHAVSLTETEIWRYE